MCGSRAPIHVARRISLGTGFDEEVGSSSMVPVVDGSGR
mgnify:CR=1 FL=1